MSPWTSDVAGFFPGPDPDRIVPHRFGTFTRFGLTLAVALTTAPAVAQSPERALPVEEYLLPQAEEVALALSAAPAGVTDGASVMVLRRDGYERVREGTDGFTCLVQRGWSSPLVPAAGPDFFLPRLLAPICFNPGASRTVLPEYLRRTELALSGHSADEMRTILLQEIGSGALEPPDASAMAYMMSPDQWIGSAVGRWHPHVMLYLPFTDVSMIGEHALESGLPLAFDYMGGPFATFVLQVRDWSTGSPDHGGSG